MSNSDEQNMSVAVMLCIVACSVLFANYLSYYKKARMWFQRKYTAVFETEFLFLFLKIQDKLSSLCETITGLMILG